MFFGNIEILDSSLQLEFLFFFFEIFTQHEDEECLLGPTIFKTFDYMVQKLLYDM